MRLAAFLIASNCMINTMNNPYSIIFIIKYNPYAIDTDVTNSKTKKNAKATLPITNSGTFCVIYLHTFFTGEHIRFQIFFANEKT